MARLLVCVPSWAAVEELQKREVNNSRLGTRALEFLPACCSCAQSHRTPSLPSLAALSDFGACLGPAGPATAQSRGRAGDTASDWRGPGPELPSGPGREFAAGGCSFPYRQQGAVRLTTAAHPERGSLRAWPHIEEILNNVPQEEETGPSLPYFGQEHLKPHTLHSFVIPQNPEELAPCCWRGSHPGTTAALGRLQRRVKTNPPARGRWSPPVQRLDALQLRSHTQLFRLRV
ncbi:uncharacterized protein ACOB7L_024590 [Callospermophilus lateralis]|uniref:uncharacterized protein LOC143410503 n=1 Tax=Callospermophilus lateralis TaxID=76772 RepID=UPI00403875BE